MIGALALLNACDDNSKTPSDAQSPRGRSDQVAAGSSAAVTAASAPTAKRPAPLPKPHKAPRKLCEGQSERDAPGTLDVARSVDGANPPPLEYGKGRWVWVNVWAAWCKPCKEEMPLLLKWRDELSDGGIEVELAFVSIDDDEREMKRFMKSQPKGGVRQSYWIQAEDAREEWFGSVGFDDSPQLPVHALVNPDGKLACVVKGAMEESDLPALKAIFAR